MLPLVDSLVQVCLVFKTSLQSILFLSPQKEILEVFYSIFHLKVPDWTEDYRLAIASIGKCLHMSIKPVHLTLIPLFINVSIHPSKHGSIYFLSIYPFI